MATMGGMRDSGGYNGSHTNDDDTLDGFAETSWSSHGPSGALHSASSALAPSPLPLSRDPSRNNRMGATAHEILASTGGGGFHTASSERERERDRSVNSSSHYSHGHGSPPSSSSRLVATPSAGPGLSIDPSHEFDPPRTASTPSISDKLRSLKLKSRAGRAPSIAGGQGQGVFGSAGATGQPYSAVGSGGAPHHSHSSSRAASAFVRRQTPQQPSSHGLGGPDELDQHMDGFDSGANSNSKRPASQFAHYPSAYPGMSFQSAMGSQTPSASSMTRSPFGDRERDREREKEREREREQQQRDQHGDPPSVNGSFESVGSAGSHPNSAAMGAGLSSLRARRRPAPMSASTTQKESQSAGYGGDRAGVTPSSPTSVNSASSCLSNPPSVHSSLSAPYSDGAHHGSSGGRYQSVSPQPEHSSGHTLAAPVVRRPRFTSEPPPPAPHLQIYSPANANGGGTTVAAAATPFGAERARALAGATGAATPGPHRHTHHNSIISVAPSSVSSSHSHSALTPHSAMGGGGFAAQFASLMDEAEERASPATAGSAASPAPYSAAFEGVSPIAASSAHHAGRRSPTASPPALTKDPYTAYDERPIGGGSRAAAAADDYASDEFESELTAHISSPAPAQVVPPAQGAAAASAAASHAASGKAQSHWDMTPQQAAAMGLMDFLPPVSSPPGTAGGPTTGMGKNTAVRAKPLVRSRPSVSIPASPSMSALHSATTAMGAAPSGATPAVHGLASPSRVRNPRATPTPSSAGPLSSPSHGGGGGGGGLTSGGSEEQYIQSADLTPFASPNSEVAGVLKGLQSSDWSVRFEAITSLRRLMVHHVSLCLPHTKAIVRDLRAEVNSLRSSLAKNGIMALGDGFTAMGRALETELEHLGPALLKRAGEPSGFLRDEAHRSLLSMLAHCSDRHTLPLLLNAAQTGTKIVKTMACVYLDRAVEVYGARGGGAALQSNKEFPRLLKAIGTFSSDAAVESRTHSKWSLIRLARIMGQDELDKTLKRSLPPAHYHAVQKVFNKGLDALVLELMAAQRDMPLANVAGSPLASPSSGNGLGSFSAKRNSATAAGGGGGGGGGLYANFLEADPGLESTSPGVLDSSGGSVHSASGLDSIKRASRRKVPPSPARAGAGAGAPAVSTSAGSLPSSTSDSGDSGSAAWSSVRSTPSGANLFDLNAVDYSTPATPAASGPSSLAGTPARGGAKRRPTMSASGLGGGGGTAAPASSSAVDTDRLNLVLEELASSDWRTRMASLEKLRAFLASAPGSSQFHAVRIFDVLCQRINDHHGKVNVAALQSLTQILPLTKPYLCSVLGSFVPSLATNLASTSPVIRQLTHSSLELLLRVVEQPLASFGRESQAALLAPLSSVALFDNIKVRPTMIAMLTSALEACADASAEAAGGAAPSGSALLGTFKAAVPVAFALCDEARLELRAPLLRCAQTLHAILGPALWDEKVCMQFHLTPQQVAKLKMMIGV